jgi:GT2 family glycosyltransferase
MNVSIILVNYNTKDLTLQTISSVYEQTNDIDFEIIVVDNASTDGSTEAIENNFPDVKLIKSGENLGFGRANNKGAEVATGRNLFFLNPDTVLLTNAVKILSEYLDNNVNIGVCGGNLYDSNKQPAHSYRMFYSPILWDLNDLTCNRLERIIYGKSYGFNYTNKPKVVAHVVGADMMIKKEVFNEVGGFDKDFFMYREETELNFRIHKKGYQSISIPDAQIIHLEGKSFSNNLNRIKRILDGRKLYFHKVSNKASYYIGNLIYCCFCLTRIALFTLSRNKEQVEVWRFVLRHL